MFRIISLFLLINFTFVCEGIAQQLSFSRRNIELPSQECYNIYQDNKGFIWFATVRGFCKYDGKTITVFDKNKGLHENSVYAVEEDSKGRIWILTRKSRILYIENDQIYEPEIGKRFSQLPELSVTNFARHFKFLDSENKLCINTLKFSYVVDLKKQTIERIEANEESDKEYLEMKYVDGEITQSSSTLYGARKKLDVSIFDEGNQEIFRTRNFKIDPSFLPKFSRTIKIREYSYFSYANILFQYSRTSNEIKKFDFPGRVICVYKDKNDGLWVGVIGNGLFYFKDGNLSEAPVHSLREYSISGVTEDAEGGVWATSLNKGIFYCRNKHVISYQDVPGLHMPSNLLVNVEGNIYATSESFGLLEINQLGVNPIDIGISLAEDVTSLVSFKQKFYVGNSVAGIETLPNFKESKKTYRSDLPMVNTSGLFKVYEDSLFSALNNHVFQFNPLTRLFDLKFSVPIKVKDFVKLNEDEWLVGDWNLIKYNTRSKRYNVIKGVDNSITKLEKTNSGRVFIATLSEGVFLYENNEVVSINKMLPELPNVVYDLLEDEDGIIWLASNTGLVRLDLEKKQVEKFGVNFGLLASDIQKIAIRNDEMYISTVEGLCAIKIDQLKKGEVAPFFYYSGAFFNGERIDLLKNQVMPYNKNNLMIKTNVLYYSSSQLSIHYELWLNGYMISSETTEGTDLVIDNLSPGNYKLIMWAVSVSGEKSEPLTFKYTIRPPFWKSIWFICLVVFIVGVTIFLTIKIAIKTIREREEEKTRVSELLANSQLMALQSQMNPHFIFNSINSIQNFILKKDVNQAYDYLTKFSQLIRLVMQNSRKRETSLQEELKVLNLYISLEQLRFDMKFEYLEKIDSEVDVFSTYVPPMLIQPIIENAIWHGIMPLNGERRGIVSLHIEVIDDEILMIIVEDNGVGRDMNKIPDSIHESISMEVTEERLKIVNLLQGDQHANMEVVDLIDDYGKAIGTRVILLIPIEKDNV